MIRDEKVIDAENFGCKANYEMNYNYFLLNEKS